MAHHRAVSLVGAGGVSWGGGPRLAGVHASPANPPPPNASDTAAEDRT